MENEDLSFIFGDYSSNYFSTGATFVGTCLFDLAKEQDGTQIPIKILHYERLYHTDTGKRHKENNGV